MNSALAVEQQELIHENLELLSSHRTEVRSKVGDSEWDYQDSGNDWYAVCDQGSMQSPIAIDLSNIVKLKTIGGNYYPFQFSYPYCKAPGAFVDKTYRAEYTEGSVVFTRPNGEESIYKSLRLEVHAPAEHIIKGKQKALELHIVHKEANSENLMILAVLFKISAHHNAFIQELIEEEGVSLNRLVIDRPELYVYCGSMTTPPCSETVLWAICAVTQQVSFEQVKYFSGKWENNQAFARGNGNNRGIQLLNSRVVFNFS